MPGPAFQTGQQSAEMCNGDGNGEGFPFCTAPTGPSCPIDAVCAASIGIGFTLGTSCAEIVTVVEVILPCLASVQPFWKMGRIYVTIRDERSAVGFCRVFFCIFLFLVLNLTIYQRWLCVRPSS